MEPIDISYAHAILHMVHRPFPLSSFPHYKSMQTGNAIKNSSVVKAYIRMTWGELLPYVDKGHIVLLSCVVNCNCNVLKNVVVMYFLVMPWYFWKQFVMIINCLQMACCKETRRDSTYLVDWMVYVLHIGWCLYQEGYYPTKFFACPGNCALF